MKKQPAKKVAKKSTAKKPLKKTTPPPKPSRSASASKTESPPWNTARVMADHQRRTCIELNRTDEQVSYVALNVELGLEVGTAYAPDFDGRFKPLVDYPVDRAAKLYIEYARGLGATEQVMKELGKLTTVTNEDIEMATKKKAARAATSAVKTEKKVSKTATKSAKSTTAKKAAKPAAAKGEPKAKKDRGPTAASMFQELIMEKGAGGKAAHTDDQIFAKVQKQFGLDDSKKSYVKWYRNYLTKQGKTPPAAKE